ncbi:unannotated protein [freshwater metagenome]|uniref:Unannotated protein n=1 Tax=freshwater metagenome TaxID=449393 RepID=A0A6J7EN11_9ZZZZ
MTIRRPSCHNVTESWSAGLGAPLGAVHRSRSMMIKGIGNSAIAPINVRLMILY